MKVWIQHTELTETTYYFFQLKDDQWFRFDMQLREWEAIKYNPRVSDKKRFRKLTAATLEREWYKMFAENAPFEKEEIAPD